MRWQPVAILLLFGVTLLSPILATHEPMRVDAAAPLLHPGAGHLLGTDMLGRDVFSRLLYGGQRTLLVAGAAMLIAVFMGGTIGVASGIAGPYGNYVLSSIVNIFLAFPNVLFAFVILTILGIGPIPLAIATGFSQIGAYGRFSRSTALRIRAQMYIEAGYAIGATRWQILRFYILPNAQSALASYAAITFSYCLLNSTTLSFLGLGGEPGVPDWGVMLAESRVAFWQAPWLAIAPGMAITLIVWAMISWVNQVNTRTLESIFL